MWGARNLTQTALQSLPQTGSLLDLVVVFHVGVVVDEIMRSVVGALEDLQLKHVQCVTFAFRRLTDARVPAHTVNTMPTVLAKMREYLGPAVVAKAHWLGVK